MCYFLIHSEHVHGTNVMTVAKSGKGEIMLTVCFMHAGTVLKLQTGGTFSLSVIVNCFYQVGVDMFVSLRVLFCQSVFCWLLPLSLKLTPWGFIKSFCYSGLSACCSGCVFDFQQGGC